MEAAVVGEAVAVRGERAWLPLRRLRAFLRLYRRTRRTRRAARRLRHHELSVVACDLRGFTAFLEATPPGEAVELLRRYYESVAAEVSRHGGVIKDHAGDGILILVGAGAASDDHAHRALSLALAIRDRAGEALRRGPAGIVGLGIGVASGWVTVGTVEAGSRRESIAVGTTVNLASRLCARAGAGRVLVAERTVALAHPAGTGAFVALESLQLKGFSQAVRLFEG